jgi:hypothetical protein
LAGEVGEMLMFENNWVLVSCFGGLETLVKGQISFRRKLKFLARQGGYAHIQPSGRFRRKLKYWAKQAGYVIIARGGFRRKLKFLAK